MKKILIAALAVSLAAATQVGAIVVNVSAISGYYAPGSSGGEFNVTPITGAGYAPSVLVGGGFETFCAARNVNISIPGTYNAVVNANGSYISTLSPLTTATISSGTAYLYSRFATGVLNHYNYTGLGFNGSANPATWLRGDSAYELQLAIWTLDLSYAYPDFTVNTFLNDIIGVGKQFASLAAAQAANAPAGYNVGTLNLSTIGNPSTPVQSMLTLLPDGGTTLMLLGMGFSSLALVSRKIRA